MTTSLLTKTVALQPTELTGITQQAINDLLREGESAHTVASYRSALQYWAAWFALRYGQAIALPVAVSCVMQFVVDHAQRTTAKGLEHGLPKDIDAALVESGHKGKRGPMAHNTLVHRVAVLSKAHQLHGTPNPCRDPQVRELLSRTRKAYAKRGALPQKKDALTKDPLQAVLATCDDSLQGRRDRALILFGWASGGRRRSEITSADMRHLKRLRPSEFIYTLAYSKTNQSGVDQPGNQKPLVGAAGVAMEDWLRASGVQQGLIFRNIRKGGQLGESLSPASVRAIVKRRCALAGVEGDFSAHSLRSGFVTEAGRQNIALADTMAMTGHRSVATVLGYFRSESSVDSPAARLLDE